MEDKTYCLEYFDKYDIKCPDRYCLIGEKSARDEVINIFLDIIENSCISIGAIISSDLEKYQKLDIDPILLFKKYSPLMKNKCFSEGSDSYIIFDDIIYNKGQIQDFYTTLNSFNTLFVQSQVCLEEYTKFDYIFICSYNEIELEKVYAQYIIDKKKISLEDFKFVAKNCIGSKEIFIVAANKKDPLEYIREKHE
jgi:hypothetical protein